MVSLYTAEFKNADIINYMTIEQIIAAQPLFVIILEFIILIGAFLGTIGAGIKWLTKHYFDEIKAELRPNHGSSLKDQVTRLEEKQITHEKNMDSQLKQLTGQHSKLEGKIDKLYDTLLDHIANTNK